MPESSFFLTWSDTSHSNNCKIVSNLSAEEAEVLSMLYTFTESHRKISVRKIISLTYT